MTSSAVSEEIRNTLDRLHGMGLKLAIGSSSKNAKFILEKVKLLEVFDAVSDGTNISRSKPDPEVFLKAAEYLGFAAEDCAVVEDAEAGIDAAKAAGMYAIGIGEAAKYKKTDCRIEKLSDLLKSFEK